MPRLLIIADDFTGALDTGVQFAACGIPTRVVVGTAADMIRCECTVLVVDTETRHLSAEAAGKIVEVLALSKAAAQTEPAEETPESLPANSGTGEAAASEPPAESVPAEPAESAPADPASPAGSEPAAPDAGADSQTEPEGGEAE